MTKKEEWLAGTRSAVPIMLGYVPVGIAYGVMARQAGLNTWQTVLMSLTVYGGASEMMAAGMVAQGAAVLTIVLTTFILNLRHIIMSTCVFNQMQGGRLPVRMLAAFGVTDETFAVYTTTANAPRTPRYFSPWRSAPIFPGRWAAGWGPLQPGCCRR
ncbi:MAG: AzlC family ABC transporter permease [Subdoligranulum sp.]